MKKLLFPLIILLALSCAITPQEGSRETHYLRIDDAYLPVYSIGPDTEKILLFVHGGPGLTSVAYFYMPFFQQLGEKYKIYFWDQRGASGSRGNIGKETITIPQFVEDMDAVYDFIKYQHPTGKVYLLGHSYGGMVGGAYASKYNDKIGGAIFISPAFNVGQINETASGVMLTAIDKILAQPILESQKHYWNRAKAFYTKHKTLTASLFIDHTKYASARDNILGLGQMTSYFASRLGAILSDPIMEGTSPISQIDVVLKSLEKNGEADRNLSTDTTFPLSKITKPVFVITGDDDLMVPPATSIDGFDHLGTPADKKFLIEYKYTSHNAFLQPVKGNLLDKIVEFVETYTVTP